MREYCKLNPQAVVASLQQAINGEIDRSMRAIFINVDEDAAKVIVYCHGKIPDDIIEDFDASVMTQMYADFDGDPNLSFEFIRLDEPAPIPCDGVRVFALKNQQYDYADRGRA